MAELTRKDLEEAMYNALKRAGGGGGGFNAGATTPGPGTGSDGLKYLKEAGTQAGKMLEGFQKEAEKSIDTFRELSRTGSNFSNDLVGMRVAAYGTRMSLEDFSKVVGDNGKYLTGLGGSVTRGTEAFGRLSKQFFDSNIDEGLRNLGYTSKELNEILALQAGIQRTANSDTQESRTATITSAAALAREMDLMAKLTGRSREEQMEIMQKNKVDGQIEARLRLMTAGKTEDEVKKIRSEAQAALLQAEREGRGQMAKELFATGTVISETARNQAATMGAATTATADQMEALRRGEFDSAKKAGERATAEMLKNQQDTTLLLQATLGSAGGPIAETMMKNIETMGPFNDAVQATAKSMGTLLKTQEDYAKAITKAMEDIRASSRGTDKDGNRVGGSVAGVVAIEKGVADIKAGAAAAAMARDKEGKSIATEASRLGDVTVEGAKRLRGPGNNIGKTIEQKAEEGIRGEGGGMIGGIASASLTAATATVNLTGNTILSITGEIQSRLAAQPVKSRSTGSLGTTGKLIEDFGQGTMAMLHGKEGVITEDQLKNLAAGIRDTGANLAIGSLKTAADKMSNLPSSGDIGEMMSRVSSTISGAPNNKNALPSIDLNSINLPGFGGSIKSATAAAAQSMKPATPTAQTRPQQTTAESKAENATQTTQTQTAARGTDASLNDVVKSLETLNKMMGQLISQSDTLGRKQITAAKSNSSNVYERF